VKFLGQSVTRCGGTEGVFTNLLIKWTFLPKVNFFCRGTAWRLLFFARGAQRWGHESHIWRRNAVTRQKKSWPRMKNHFGRCVQCFQTDDHRALHTMSVRSKKNQNFFQKSQILEKIVLTPALSPPPKKTIFLNKKNLKRQKFWKKIWKNWVALPSPHQWYYWGALCGY
jgi:hypothetical protein